ncbi:unnamed protein product [Kluyveromyces dobzhanskii CBS 2104]|uniref:WGS project CCBQ000000000 data, contig 00107 n=1 Tax=Kluyveromyces dobzhanskii CBS 2104 TaxID=1427455 RepID=A0A0A8L116_9SACH|nr:unnamed protein product [Kluyveromyces dobzhanskii CBS 2104]
MVTDIIDLSAGTEELELQVDAGKEVYETSDTDEPLPEPLTTEGNDDIVEESIAKVGDKQELFQHSILSSKDTDFSGRLYALPTYNVKHINETATQRLARIQRELLELEQHELENENGSNQLRKLNQLYEKLSESSEGKMKKIQSQLSSAVDKQADGEVRLPNIKIEGDHLKKLESLEQKLSALELQIGSSNTNKSITSTINELYREIDILKLDGPALKNFQEKMKEISDEYDQSIIGRRSQKDPKLSADIEKNLKSTESKVNDIYDKYNILSKYSKLIPHITERIQSLNCLHISINDMNDTVSEINDHLFSVHSQIDKWSLLLDSTAEQLDRNEKDFSDTRSTLEKQLTALEKRVNNLNG